jgi:hypothetical protein
MQHVVAAIKRLHQHCKTVNSGLHSMNNSIIHSLWLTLGHMLLDTSIPVYMPTCVAGVKGWLRNGAGIREDAASEELEMMADVVIATCGRTSQVCWVYVCLLEV